MTKNPHISPEDRFGRQLKRDAFVDEPPFSPTLHARIMRAVDQQRPIELANTSPLNGARPSSRSLPIGVAVSGVAVAAVLLVCVAVYVARPRGDLVAVDTSDELRLASAVEVADPLTAAVTDFTELARSVPDDLVNTVVLTHWNYLDQHADEIATFLLDPLPIEIQQTALE